MREKKMRDALNYFENTCIDTFQKYTPKYTPEKKFHSL